MQLLIAVVSQEERLDEILSGFLELGITGATVIRSEGMRSLLSQEVPIFAGLQSLLSRARPQNHTLFTVIEDDARVEAAIALIDRLSGGLQARGAGIVFTVPLNRVLGVEPQP